MNTNTNEDSKAKITTLFGGTQLQVIYEDGTSDDVRVRQLRLVEYEAALKLISDEFALTAFCSSLDATPAAPCNKDFVLKIHPKSYEALYSKVREVNAEGFFSYAARKQAEEDAINARWVKQAAELPPEILATAMRGGKSALPTSSPRPR